MVFLTRCFRREAFNILGIDRSHLKYSNDPEEFENIDFKDATFFEKQALGDDKIR